MFSANDLGALGIGEIRNYGVLTVASANIHLTHSAERASLRTLFGGRYVKDLQHHRFEGYARQYHSSPWYGEEKGRRRPARDQESPKDVQSESARAPRLGA